MYKDELGEQFGFGMNSSSDLNSFNGSIVKGKIGVKAELPGRCVPAADGSHGSRGATGVESHRTDKDESLDSDNNDIGICKDIFDINCTTSRSENPNSNHTMHVSAAESGGVSSLIGDLNLPTSHPTFQLDIEATGASTSKRFPCPECGRTFSQLGSLQTHIRIHTGVKPYRCHDCDKSFTQLGSLQLHKRTHTGEKPFPCAHCGKRFTQKVTLQVHERTHTGEKPFSCRNCGKSFTQKGSLQSHERIHSGDRPYQCIVCLKTFSQLASVQAHVRIHTGERPYRCQVCQLSFTQASSLRMHLTKSHPEVTNASVSREPSSPSSSFPFSFTSNINPPTATTPSPSFSSFTPGSSTSTNSSTQEALAAAMAACYHPPHHPLQLMGMFPPTAFSQPRLSPPTKSTALPFPAPLGSVALTLPTHVDTSAIKTETGVGDPLTGHPSSGMYSLPFSLPPRQQDRRRSTSALTSSFIMKTPRLGVAPTGATRGPYSVRPLPQTSGIPQYCPSQFPASVGLRDNRQAVQSAPWNMTRSASLPEGNGALSFQTGSPAHDEAALRYMEFLARSMAEAGYHDSRQNKLSNVPGSVLAYSNFTTQNRNPPSTSTGSSRTETQLPKQINFSREQRRSPECTVPQKLDGNTQSIGRQQVIPKEPVALPNCSGEDENTMEGTTYICIDCGQSFDSKRILESHQVTAHGDTGP